MPTAPTSVLACAEKCTSLTLRSTEKWPRPCMPAAMGDWHAWHTCVAGCLVGLAHHSVALLPVGTSTHAVPTLRSSTRSPQFARHALRVAATDHSTQFTCTLGLTGCPGIVSTQTSTGVHIPTSTAVGRPPQECRQGS
eukprot:jgi/Ulvmu1/945/UM102_0028.1